MIRKQLIPALFTIAMLLCITSCDKIRQLKTFDLDYNTSFEIPATGFLGGLVQTPPQRVETNSSSALEDQGTKSKWVESVCLSKMSGTITSGNSDFDFLESIEVYVAADGFDEILLAYSYNIPQNVKTINLTPGSQNLKELLIQDSFQLRTVSEASNSGKVTISADLVFEVEARLKWFD
jgi:hypothetical protein